jgi:hypothetical protein
VVEVTYVDWKAVNLLGHFKGEYGEAKLFVAKDMGTNRYFWSCEWPAKRAKKIVHNDGTIGFTIPAPGVRVGGVEDNIEQAKAKAITRAGEGRPK